jgi:hypothetical protein
LHTLFCVTSLFFQRKNLKMIKMFGRGPPPSQEMKWSEGFTGWAGAPERPGQQSSQKSFNENCLIIADYYFSPEVTEAKSSFHKNWKSLKSLLQPFSPWKYKLIKFYQFFTNSNDLTSAKICFLLYICTYIEQSIGKLTYTKHFKFVKGKKRNIFL